MLFFCTLVYFDFDKTHESNCSISHNNIKPELISSSKLNIFHTFVFHTLYGNHPNYLVLVLIISEFEA